MPPFSQEAFHHQDQLTRIVRVFVEQLDCKIDRDLIFVSQELCESSCHPLVNEGHRNLLQVHLESEEFLGEFDALQLFLGLVREA